MLSFRICRPGFVVGLLFLILALQPGEVALPTVSGSTGEDRPCKMVFDRRINHRPDEACSAPVAIYDDPLSVYAIDPGNGELRHILTIASEQVEAVGIPDKHMLLGEAPNAVTGYPVRIYRLATGEFQINTWRYDGQPYVFIWDEDDLRPM